MTKINNDIWNKQGDVVCTKITKNLYYKSINNLAVSVSDNINPYSRIKNNVQYGKYTK